MVINCSYFYLTKKYFNEFSLIISKMKINKLICISIILITLTSCSNSNDDSQDEIQSIVDIEKPDHLITTPSSYKVSSLLMSSVEYSNWKSEDHFSDGTYREALIKDIYKQFSDKYDFIMLVLNEEEIPEGINYYGKNIGVSNNVSGIGGGIYDYTSNYGSSGKLKSVMQLSSLGFLQNGPALHELLHNWANYALPTENVNETGLNLVSFSYYGHWGFTGGSTRGQLGGFKQSTLEDLGNNQYAVEPFGAFANGGNSVPYNELELYLMGMIPINSVSQFDLFNDITAFEINNNKYTFTANRLSYGPAELESLLGARSPNSLNSQKEFDLLLIVLSNEQLTNDQWEIINDAAEWFSFKGVDQIPSYNFWEATNGIGSINIEN